MNYAISDYDGDQLFYSNPGAVATLDVNHYTKWKNSVKFEQETVQVKTMATFFKENPGEYRFINLDVEGTNLKVLMQIDLEEYGCEMICVEHNSKDIEMFVSYCDRFGLKEIHRNAENLICAL